MLALPAQLLQRPFTADDARRYGVTVKQLRGRRCRRVFRGVYIGSEVELTVPLLAEAISLVLPAGAVVGRTTAALLHGADVRAIGDAGIDIISLREGQVRRAGIRSSAALLEHGDVVHIGNVALTSPIRTAFDLGRNRNPIEAVVGVDAMLNRGGATLPALTAYLATHRGWFGVRWAAEAITHAEPRSESPMESRQRMRLVYGGLPRPVAQHVLTTGATFVARLDHAYPEFKVAPEYDGEDHARSWRADLERQEAIRSLGWWHRRYTSATIRGGWEAMVQEVRAALVARGWRPKDLANSH